MAARPLRSLLRVAWVGVWLGVLTTTALFMGTVRSASQQEKKHRAGELELTGKFNLNSSDVFIKQNDRNADPNTPRSKRHFAASPVDHKTWVLPKARTGLREGDATSGVHFASDSLRVSCAHCKL